jgi:hypothetical protein
MHKVDPFTDGATTYHIRMRAMVKEACRGVRIIGIDIYSQLHTVVRDRIGRSKMKNRQRSTNLNLRHILYAAVRLRRPLSIFFRSRHRYALAVIARYPTYLDMPITTRSQFGEGFARQ